MGIENRLVLAGGPQDEHDQPEKQTHTKTAGAGNGQRATHPLTPEDTWSHRQRYGDTQQRMGAYVDVVPEGGARRGDEIGGIQQEDDAARKEETRRNRWPYHLFTCGLAPTRPV